MASFELKVRRVAALADTAFVAAVAAVLLIAIASGGHVSARSAVFVGLTFGAMVVAHFGVSLLHAHPETRRETARGVVWLANACIALMVFLVYQVIFPPTMFGGGMNDTGPSLWLGVPVRFWVTGVAIAAVLGGRWWIHRILQDGREPEANDRFWWSRA